MIAMEKLRGAAVSGDTSMLLQQLEEALSTLHQKDAKCQELSVQVRRWGLFARYWGELRSTAQYSQIF